MDLYNTLTNFSVLCDIGHLRNIRPVLLRDQPYSPSSQEVKEKEDFQEVTLC